MKKLIPFILSIVLSTNLLACAGTQVPIHTAADTVRVNTQDPYKHKYLVTFQSGEKYSFSDEEINVKDDLIGFRFEDEERYKYYSQDQLQQMRIKRKTHWLTGAGIGAAAGGLGLGLGFGLGAKCTGGDESECKLLHILGTVGFATLGAGVGFGIGAAIGAAVPKKKEKVDVSVSPKIYGDKEMNITGGGIGIRGSF